MINKIGWAALDTFAALLVAHMVWYGFTGQSLVAPLDHNDGLARVTILVALHIMVPLGAVMRRA